MKLDILAILLTIEGAVAMFFQDSFTSSMFWIGASICWVGYEINKTLLTQKQ